MAAIWPEPVMSPQQRLLQAAICCGALRFGQFTLKSGRISPYFFNAGHFASGASLSALAAAYADTLINASAGVDMLFGPAYKGIPLVAALSQALYLQHGMDLPYAYNRKESKDHGEGGLLVGAALRGKVWNPELYSGNEARGRREHVDTAELIAGRKAPSLRDGPSATRGSVQGPRAAWNPELYSGNEAR
jgi:hypothetical protein